MEATRAPGPAYAAFPGGAVPPSGHPGLRGPSGPDRFVGYPEDDPLARIDLARRRRRLASYSLLARRSRPFSAENVEGRFDKDEAPDSSAPPGAGPPDAAAPEIPGNALPGGRETGNLLHEILEEIDFAAVGSAAAPADLLAPGPVRDLLEARMLEHRLAPEWLPGVAGLIFNALHARLPDPAGGAPFRLADVAERLPEMEFLFPCAAQEGSSGPDGYLWGFIDLVFRHRGRYYLLDWKSNRLDAYGRADLDRSMAESRYDAQYRLYALALDRWLSGLVPGYACDLHFGGVYYLYLRGIRPEAPEEGIFSLRPDAAALRGEYPRSLSALLSEAGLRGRIDAAAIFPEAA
jgi:ATP-dependent exoDNAse (exonuclease V) beta subunit